MCNRTCQIRLHSIVTIFMAAMRIRVINVSNREGFHPKLTFCVYLLTDSTVAL